MKRFYFTIIVLFVFSLSARSQGQLTLYQLNGQVPQANNLNAGLFPDYKVSIGIPVLSSTYVSANGGQLSLNRAFTRTAEDSLHFDPQKLTTYLDETNRIETFSNVQLFYLGLMLQKNFFSLSLNERLEGGITYPKTLVELLAAGNGEYVGKVMAFDNLGIRAQVFHEIALGYGRNITDKLSVGIRAKFLSGIASINMNKMSAALRTTTDSLNLYVPAFNMNTTGLDLLDGSGNIFKAATAFNNTGFAVDIGAHYQLTEKLQVSLAVNDLGGIYWKNNTRQFQFSEVNYTYTGVNIIDAIQNNNQQTNLLNQELDSLRNLFTADTVDGLGYKTRLSPKFYAGGSYSLGKHHTFGLMVYGDVLKGNFKPAVGVSYNLQLGRIWTLGINASYRNKSFNNFGVGTALTLGPVQLYFVTENVVALARYADTRLVDARVGLNLVFGKKEKPPKAKMNYREASAPAPRLAPTPITPVLTEQVTTAIIGTAPDELPTGFYVVIASLKTQAESSLYNEQLQAEGYMALSGYQSEKGKYFTYLMYYPADGNKAIAKKNDLLKSMAPGLEKPWVLWVKDK